MTQAEFQANLEYFGMVHSVTSRVISAFSDQDLDYRASPDMRTVRGLVFHIYAQEKALAESIAAGAFSREGFTNATPESPEMAATLGRLATTADLRAFAEECHNTAVGIFGSLSEEALNRAVDSPLGTYPAWRYFDFVYDEHWHHRGQLYTYLRLLGKEPPMLYDY